MELMKKTGLTADERRELEALHAALTAFRKEHPHWSADAEPLRVSLLDAAKFPSRFPRRTRS